MSIGETKRTGAGGVKRGRSEGVRVSDTGSALLVQAGAVLSTSLDPRTTMSQVASLTVPALADLCTIDLLDRDGSITDAAVVASQPGIAPALEALRAEHPLDPDGEHPVARVIRSGEPELQASMDDALLRSFAQSSEHAAFMVGHRYRSAAVAPLLARGRTLGALSTLRLGDGAPYDEADLGLISELARRAALAIDNARLFSDLTRVEQRLEAILVNLAEAVTVTDADGRIVFANQAAAELVGAGGPSELIDGQAGGLVKRMTLEEEANGDALVVRATVTATGGEHWLLVRTSALEDPETGRQRWTATVFEDITEMKRTQLGEAFLADASARLSASTGLEETARLVAQLPVPELADWCAVDLLDDAGRLERLAVHHRDAGERAAGKRTAGERAAIERRGPAEGTERGTTSVQLLSSYRRIGAIVLGRDGEACALTGARLRLAEELADRAGHALERARMYTERSRIAHTLQQALLPASLPDLPGFEVEVRYCPAGELNEVGGDFYDVIECGEGRWLLVIGDVCGKGPRAAGVTALARHTLRAAAILGEQPLQMLNVLHQALRAQPVGADLCTVCLVSVQRDGDAAQLEVVLAGHPQPLLIEANGTVHPVGKPGTLLGVIDPIEVEGQSVRLTAGETLLLFTDGVADAGRSSGTLSEEGLSELCSAARGSSLAQLLARVELAALERTAGMRRDDIALLGLRLA